MPPKDSLNKNAYRLDILNWQAMAAVKVYLLSLNQVTFEAISQSVISIGGRLLL